MMKYNELIKILKEKVTDDMFETLVMNKFFYTRSFKVLNCEVAFDNLKIYKLQEWITGEEYYLIINPSCKECNKNLFPDDKYMIANKDEDTLFYLVNELNGASHKDFPMELRWLIPVLDDFEEDKSTARQHIHYRFTDKIEKNVTQEHRAYAEKQKKLFDKAMDCAIAKLLEEKYIVSKEDWNKKTGKIKLTGEKGENRICRWGFVPPCYVAFTVKEPSNIFNMIFNDENDIPEYVEKVIEIIKSKKRL